MCKHCDKLFSGNSNEYLNCAEINTNGVFMGIMASFIGDNDINQPVLSTILMSTHGENIALSEIAIGWCPICGRLLANINPS